MGSFQILIMHGWTHDKVVLYARITKDGCLGIDIDGD
jgi:hypothetical protein